MARKATLKDLNDYLSQNPNAIEYDDIKSKEDFIRKSPNNLVSIKKVSSKIEESKPKYNNIEIAEIAEMLHQKAKKESKSFTELWLSILEEGAKKDPLLKNASIFQTLRTINKTTFNVAMEGFSQLIKSKK